MSLSSFCVVSNALRLNFVRINPRSEENSFCVERTLIIEGMMCEHCEARVRTALEGLCKVIEVDHKENIAKIRLEEKIPDKRLKAVVEAQGYEVKEIK